MRDLLTIGRLAFLVTAWLAVQLSGQLVLCHGHDGHVTVESALHGHCDDHHANHDDEHLHDESASQNCLSLPGCKDVPIQTDVPDHVISGITLRKEAPSPSIGMLWIPATAQARSNDVPTVAMDGRPPSLHLSHLRTIVLLI